MAAATDAGTWCNHTGNQCCHPVAVEHPGTLARLVELVRDAEKEHRTVRAVGAHHSWSDVALTDGYLIEPDGLGGPLLDLDDGTLIQPPPESGPLARVLAGTPLHELNPLLHAEDLALPNMGGYDAQTLAGVVSTSTHGSGIGFGPFPDMVRSLDIVVAGGRVLRVEPERGITDRARFHSVYGDARTLIQDDTTFAAAICSMGCMGLINAVVLELRHAFNLKEIRALSTWEAVRDALTEDGILAQHEHYELFVNPYARKDGAHELLVTCRNQTDEKPSDLPPDRRMRHPLLEWESSLPVVWRATGLLARYAPAVMAWRFGWLLRHMCDEGYTDVSYKVFNIGEANHIPAYSAELAVSLEAGAHVQAVERIFEIAARCREDGLIHTSPIALRFVAPSHALVSMMHGRPTMMVELILAAHTRRGEDLLAEYARELSPPAVRPHWGQINTLDADTDFAKMYSGWPAWLDVYRDFNRSGVFNSQFTDRIGISVG